MQDEQHYFAPGQILIAPGHTYLTEAMLGEGGMGTVYRALDRDTGNEVAVKVLHPAHARKRGDIYERFLREARIPGQIVKRIKNRSTRTATKYLLKVTAIGELAPHGAPYYAMTHLSGGTVQELMERARLRALKLGQKPGLPVDAALNVAIGLLFSLEALHQCGVVHRDVKPANIFVHEAPGERPAVVLLDYGIAHLMDQGSRTGVAGSQGYIAPEHLANEISPAADIFAVGVLLFMMLAGVKPASRMSGTWPERGETRHAPSLAPFGVVPALVDLVARCLALDPRDRPAALELYEELQEISNSLPAVDFGTAITENDPVPRTAPGENHTGLSVAECSPATSPDLDLTPRMNALRLENERRTRLGLPQTNHLPENQTTPMAGRPFAAAAPRQMTVPMGRPLLAPAYPPARSAALDLVTLPPLSSLPSPNAFEPISIPRYATDPGALAPARSTPASHPAVARTEDSAEPVRVASSVRAARARPRMLERLASLPGAIRRSVAERLVARQERSETRARERTAGEAARAEARRIADEQSEEQELTAKQRQVVVHRRQRREAEARGEVWSPPRTSRWDRWVMPLTICTGMLIGGGATAAVVAKHYAFGAKPSLDAAPATVDPPGGMAAAAATSVGPAEPVVLPSGVERSARPAVAPSAMPTTSSTAKPTSPPVRAPAPLAPSAVRPVKNDPSPLIPFE